MHTHAASLLTRPPVRFSVGQWVEKFTGDYVLKGEVRSIFTKRNGVVRIVVEHEPGFLHIYAPENLRECNSPEDYL